MEKAWELKGLVDGLKAQGLDIAEDAAKVVAVSVLDWVEQSVKLSENKYDDLIVTFLPMAKAEVLKLVDKIDGKIGE